MVNAGLIVIAFGCAAIGGYYSAKSQHYKKKFKDLHGEYDKRCKELTNALGEVGRVKLLNEDVMKENKTLDTKVDKLQSEMKKVKDSLAKSEKKVSVLSDEKRKLETEQSRWEIRESKILTKEKCLEEIMNHGIAHLHIAENYPNEYQSAMNIVIRYPRFPQYPIVVKSFNYDKNDPSDREFAIREAEELIETIQKF